MIQRHIPATRWHVHPLRVRYQETDRMQVVFHANYVNWFEIGRTEWVRYAGIPYAAIEEQGMLLPVTELECRFVKPARYDDQIVVCTRMKEFSPLRLAFESQIRLVGETTEELLGLYAEPPGELLVEGGTRHVWVDRNFRPARLDKAAPELYALIQRAALDDNQ
ncbi:acyl-CoA thioesterase [Paenibacillus sp. GCM10012307]|uniref:Acyl-CoA thioesterase n=1 Tax=Paenibacillus roseus TaxID=2798579 RepID=A0A934IZE4_9BACL|nr:thioesterase family protein [Paenibacillus roseus]MBJ6362041.1 acyl-CoA thioesterase [Paenibacillus roseus]